MSDSTRARSLSFRKGPLASRPDNSGSRRLAGQTPGFHSKRTESTRDGTSPQTSSWEQPVNINFRARADVHLAVRDDRRDELHSRTGLVTFTAGHRTVPVFDRQISRVVGMQHRGTALRRWTVLAGVNGPDNSVRRALRRNRRGPAGKVENVRRLRRRGRCELPRGGVENELLQLIASSPDI